MDFKKFLGHNKDGEKISNQTEIQRIKNEIDEEDRIFQQELQAKDKLLNKFELDQLKQLCIDMLGREPEPEYFEEKETGKQIELPQYRNDYVHFIIEELRLSQIKDYALKNKIISASFFEK
ncbi:MAG: hypothetical protein D4R72_04865 [Nitrosopumilales archaeon]|nr:MAG: hypothetical protein D4R72_04865 [Nitrosopumilales archaeon]